MYRTSTRTAVVLITTVACTAGPIALPRGEAPKPCAFDEVITVPDAAPATSTSPVLGRAWIPRTDSDEVGWFDPVTLRSTSAGRAALPEQTSSWAVSPGGDFVAIGLTEAIRVIEPETLRTVADLRRGSAGQVLSWLSDGSLVNLTSSEAAVWEPGLRGVRMFDLPGGILTWYAASDRVLAVTGPEPPGHGPVHLVVVDAAGARTIELEMLTAGFVPDRGEIGVRVTPGLAYDPAGRRAFVVPPEGPIVEIHLTDGTVRYQPSPESFVDTIASSFLPAALAKMGEWETIRAAWLGDGLLAVSGETGGTFDLDVSAAGVSIVDIRDWNVCVLDARPTHVAVTGDVLLTWGGAEFGEHGGTGLVGYDLTDGERWHRFGRQYIDVQVYGSYAYAINSWNGWRVRTVDVGTGEVLARHRGRPPTVLSTGMSLQAW